MRSLVLGGNGFLGSHLVDGLVERGHEVTVFDRFSTGERSYLADGVREVVGDFADRASVARAVEGHERLFHFLSTTNPVTSAGDPTFDLRTNVLQSVELLSACAEAGVREVIFASTGGALYGDQHDGPFTETTLPRPLSPYGIGKQTVEAYLRFFERSTGMRSLVVRIANPYGPRQRASHGQGLIAIALRAAQTGEPLVRFGDGSMVRDYIYVEDATRMVLAISEAEHRRHDTYNVGSGVGSTVNEVLDVVQRVTGRELAIVERAVPPAFVARSILDTSRLEVEYGTLGATGLEAGIAQTWAWMNRG